MPEPNRPPWRVEDQLGGWPIWSLTEQRVTVVIACDACPHSAKWTPVDLDRRLGQHRVRFALAHDRPPRALGNVLELRRTVADRRCLTAFGKRLFGKGEPPRRATARCASPLGLAPSNLLAGGK